MEKSQRNLKKSFSRYYPKVVGKLYIVLDASFSIGCPEKDATIAASAGCSAINVENGL